jgi:hypothetical protein
MKNSLFHIFFNINELQDITHIPRKDIHFSLDKKINFNGDRACSGRKTPGSVGCLMFGYSVASRSREHTHSKIGNGKERGWKGKEKCSPQRILNDGHFRIWHLIHSVSGYSFSHSRAITRVFQERNRHAFTFGLLFFGLSLSGCKEWKYKQTEGKEGKS